MGGNPGGEGEWREGKWGKGVRRSIVRWWMETRLLMVDTLWCIQCQTAMLYTWNLFNIINQCDLNLKTYMCIYTYIYTYAYVYMEKKWTCRSFTWGMRISQWGLLLSSIHAFLGCNNSRCSENVLGVCTRAGEGSWGNGGGGGAGKDRSFFLLTSEFSCLSRKEGVNSQGPESWHHQWDSQPTAAEPHSATRRVEAASF